MAEYEDDPRHINNVRARRAADGAEADMYRAIAREIDGPPPPGIFTILKRALETDKEVDGGYRRGAKAEGGHGC